MKQHHHPLRAQVHAIQRVFLPSLGIGRLADATPLKGVDDLLTAADTCVNTHFMPMCCRYRLLDADGKIIFVSRRVVLGDALPDEVDIAYMRPGQPLSRRACFDYRPWSIIVDRRRLVPEHLQRQAVRAEILAAPSLPVNLRRPEKLIMSLSVESSVPKGLYLSQKNRKFALDMKTKPHIHPLVRKVADAVCRNSLLESGDKVIVALSGGADSVALLASLTELGFECMAAHCNFHLRGAESQRDMRHAEAVCRSLGVDMAVKDFDVAKRRRQTGESVEMACRALRYDWFDNLLLRERARAVAVGHHSEDNVETFMLNLFRGTGIDGLRGMSPRRDYVIRPMLDCSRAMIEDYLRSRGLTFVNDSSNASDDYLRNRLRNRVLPAIESDFPGASRAILTAATNLSAVARIYHRAIGAYRHRFVDPDGAVHLADLVDELGEADSFTVLRELLKDIGLNASQCSDIIASRSGSGLVFEADNGISVELDRGVLSISRPDLVKSPSSYPVDLRRDLLTPINLRVSRHHISEFAPSRDPDVIYLDESALDADAPWRLRRWQTADRIHPFGLNGSRLVSDLFSDAKFSAADKRRAWLLTCGDQIVWVVGLRPSAHFPVTPDTRRFLKIRFRH